MKSVPPARPTNELLPLLIPVSAGPDEIDEAAQAALDNAIVYLEVDDIPIPGVKYALELASPRVDKTVLVLAERAGPPTGALFPLELRPLGARAALSEFLGESGQRRSSLPVIELDPFEGRLLGGGRYEVGSLIAEGAMGRVYRGRHLLLDKAIAIKVLHAQFAQDPRFLAHFQGEARAASRLDHPNVTRVFDFGQDDDGLLFIVMELLEGTDLWQLGHGDAPFSLEVVVDYMSQICAALSVAHDRGIVHRDVKAENILVVEGEDDDGQTKRIMKVCDFGLAMTTSAVTGSDAKAQMNGGTPEYMAPEAIRGEAVDARTDVYACGVLLYFLATGKLPFDDEDQRKILSMQLMNPVVPPHQLHPEIDPALELVILKALEKDKALRYANARELRLALRGLRSTAGAPMSARSGMFAAVSQHSPDSSPTGPISRRAMESRPSGGRLRDRSSGLGSMVEGLTRAILTGECSEDFLAIAPAVLANRSQVAFFRAEAQKPDLSVQDKSDEELLGVALGDSTAAAALADALGRAGITVLALREGLDPSELVALAHLARGVGDPKLAPHVWIVFDANRLGRRRSLRWEIDLAATQLAAALLEIDPALRAHALAAALRSTRTPEAARALLESSDLVAAASGKSPWEVASAVAEGLAQTVCLRLVANLADDLVVGDSMGGARVPPELVRLFSRRLARDRTTDSDELLRTLLSRGLITASDVPLEFNQKALAELKATELISAPAHAFVALEAATDDETFQRELGALDQAIRILLSQGRLVALAAVAARLAAPGWSSTLAPAVTRLQSILQTPNVLERLGLVLLRGPAASHAAANTLLVTAGELGARALVTARLKPGELDLGARKRFATAMRTLSGFGVLALIEALTKLGPDGTDAALAEDLLHALPDRVPDEAVVVVTSFRLHPSARVRRATLGALTAISGQHSEWALLEALADQDEGVQLAALIGLRKVGRLGAEAVGQVEGFLAPATSDELRAAAAGALRACSSTARARAAAALSRVLKPKLGSRFGLSADDEESPMVLEAAALALAEVAGPEGRRMIEARASSAKGELKRRLLAVLAG